MPLYENVFLARQDVSSQQVTALTESLSGIVKDNGGEVTKTEYWGLRNLAYRIKKNRKAHYVLMNIDAPVEAVREMERNMGINETVIRHMTLRVDQLEEGPSVMMRNKVARDERPRRDERHGAFKEEAKAGRKDEPKTDLKEGAKERAEGEANEKGRAKADEGAQL